jgi:hypothetical protein
MEARQIDLGPELIRATPADAAQVGLAADALRLTLTPVSGPDLAVTTATDPVGAAG